MSRIVSVVLLPAVLGFLAAGEPGWAETYRAPVNVPIYVNPTLYSPHYYSIYAAIGGGPMLPYLFDTGAPVFMTTVANAPGPAIDSISYASGNSFDYSVENTAVSLGDMNQNVIATTASMAIGDIVSYQWQGGPTTPAEGRALPDGLYGDFGASYNGTSAMATALSQFHLGGGLVQAYAVNVAGLTGQSPEQGTLTIGLTPAMIAAAAAAPGAIVMPLDPSGQSPLPNPDGGTITSVNKTQVAGTSVAYTDARGTTTATLGTVFDSGGSRDTTIYSRDYPHVDGGRVTVSYDGQTFVDFDGTTPAGGVVSVKTHGDPRINLGAYNIYGFFTLVFVPQSTQWNSPGQLILIPGSYDVTSVPEIDPAGFGSVIGILLGSLGLMERRRTTTA